MSDEETPFEDLKPHEIEGLIMTLYTAECMEMSTQVTANEAAYLRRLIEREKGKAK